MNPNKARSKGVQHTIKSALATAHVLIIEVALVVVLLIHGAEFIKYTFERAFQPRETVGSGIARKHRKRHRHGKHRHHIKEA
jgi:hypothetical protein